MGGSSFRGRRLAWNKTGLYVVAIECDLTREEIVATKALTGANFDSTVSVDGIVLVDCWASWCAPCRRFSPIFEAASEENPDIVFGTVDTEAERDLAQMLHIQMIPTVMAFREGIMVARESGAFTKKQFDELVERVRQLDIDDIRKELESIE
jgi:thioredoxin 1